MTSLFTPPLIKFVLFGFVIAIIALQLISPRAKIIISFGVIFIVGILAADIYNAVGVIEQNPIYLLYGIGATILSNIICFFLTFADEMKKMQNKNINTKIDNPLLQGALCAVIVTIEIHLYAEAIFKMATGTGRSGDIFFPFILSFISAVLLKQFFRHLKNPEQTPPQTKQQ